jgi:hypothetical protein
MIANAVVGNVERSNVSARTRGPDQEPQIAFLGAIDPTADRQDRRNL